MTDTATLTARLTEAREALHKLLTGTDVVEIDYGGRKVRFSKTSLVTGEQQLRQYIAELEVALGETPSRTRRALGVRFS